jgi:hypothetical protein
MITFEDVTRLVAHLPEIAESTSYRTQALKVRARPSAGCLGRANTTDTTCTTSRGSGVLRAREKPFLIEANGGWLFTTPH